MTDPRIPQWNQTKAKRKGEGVATSTLKKGDKVRVNGEVRVYNGRGGTDPLPKKGTGLPPMKKVKKAPAYDSKKGKTSRRKMGGYTK